MAREAKRIDVERFPDLLSIVNEVRAEGKPRILRSGAEDIAIIAPVRPPTKRVPRGRPTSDDDPLWDMVGIGKSEKQADVSENKYKYLAEAHGAKAP